MSNFEDQPKEKPEEKFPDTPQDPYEQLKESRQDMIQEVAMESDHALLAIDARNERLSSQHNLTEAEVDVFNAQHNEIGALRESTSAKMEASAIGESLEQLPTLVPCAVPHSPDSGEHYEGKETSDTLIGDDVVHEKTEATIDPEKHTKYLRETVKSLLDDPLITQYYGRISKQDITKFRTVLSREANNSKLGPFANLLRSVVNEKINDYGAEAELQSQEQLRAMLVEMHHDFTSLVQKKVGVENILGLKEFPTEHYSERSVLLERGQKNLGPGPLQGFVTALIRNEFAHLVKTPPSHQPSIEKKPLRERAQNWLRQDREMSYARLGLMFDNLFDQGGVEAVQQWLLDYFNPFIEQMGREPLKLEDVKSLTISHAVSKSATEIAGQEISRSLLLFTDTGEYQRFSSRLQGEAGMASRGMNIPRELFSEGDILHETGLLIASPNKVFIGHEILHSIDPHLGQRKGYDRLIEEAFAYYTEEIVNANPKHYAHLKDPAEGPWRFLANSISGESYWQKYSQEAEGKLTMDAFHTRAHEISQAIRNMSDTFGHVEAQRMLVATKTVEELLELSNTDR